MGLFLLRRVRICKVRLISSSRPITGSSLPWRAISFKLRAYFCNALYCCDDVWELTVEPFLNSSIAAFSPFSVRPASLSRRAVPSLTCIRPSNKCSTLTNSSLNSFRDALALSSTLFISRLNPWAGSPPLTFGNLFIASSTFVSTKATFKLFFFNKKSTGLSSSFSSALSKWSVSMLGLPLLYASC